MESAGNSAVGACLCCDSSSETRAKTYVGCPGWQGFRRGTGRPVRPKAPGRLEAFRAEFPDCAKAALPDGAAERKAGIEVRFMD